MSDNTTKFTSDEKIIAKNIDKKYKWIARDSDGNLHVYKGKPKKEESSWYYYDYDYGYLYYFNHLFLDVKWEDDEPTRISDIYNPQILDEEEREYLKMVLEPFHDGVIYVEKLQPHTIDGRVYNKEYLHIKLHDEGFSLPSFDRGKMYSGMEPNKKYTLEELEL